MFSSFRGASSRPVKPEVESGEVKNHLKKPSIMIYLV